MLANPVNAASVASLPIELREPTLRLLQQWHECLAANSLDFTADTATQTALSKIWACSLFVAENSIRQPDILIDLLNSGDLANNYENSGYNERLAGLTPQDEADLMRQLRQFRRREMLRIAWRDLAGWADLSETLMDLSLLADACIQTALAFLYQQACLKRGTPLLADGSPQQLVVLGMGKLGAYELNFSSDIDLIFAYPEDGVLPDRKARSYGEFFTRLCQSLVKVLDEITVDGFVFRTDIRLRPYGDSGAIIMTFDGMEHYYLTQAREWERYAMIKARQVAGDFSTGAALMAMLQRFVYRRYLDYGAFAELRSLKAQISQELQRKDRLDNIKLGKGGIREVEFIGQAFQLIRGGSEKSLQIRSITAVLTKLGELGLLSETDATALIASYGFLRRVENHIQQYQDKQTHDLPTNPTAKASLAYSLDFPDWASFAAALAAIRAQVHGVFEQVFALTSQQPPDDAANIWFASNEDAELLATLKNHGFQDSAATLAALKQFKHAPAIRRLSSKGAEVVNTLMPKLLRALKSQSHPDICLQRVLAIFEAVAGRTVYLSLLAENPDALAQLLRLTAASPWISDYLAQHPILFDELVDPRSLFTPLQATDLDKQLSKLLAAQDQSDEEQLMNALRQFKQQQILKVAAADISGVIPVMVVSDYLSYIAESLVKQAVQQAWQLLVAKHGLPPNASTATCGFAVLAFGKLGGLELGYGSDLDLVFICNYPDGPALTNGAKAIACSQFYGRLGQKVRHLLDTQLLSGVCYEVDMRLRPNGDSGLLVNHIDYYENYLRQQAWTWEHQALVRSRFIAGDLHLQADFQAIRQRILCLPRALETLKTEVREMREKMRAALLKPTPGLFDLKQGNGGIADIEFMVQFLVLAYAADYPQLTVHTDNNRLLASLADCQLLPSTTTSLLKTAYCSYRDLGHKQALQGMKALIAEAEVLVIKTEIESVWQQLMF